MQKRRIILLINSLSAGGSEKQSLYLTRLLSNHHNVRLVVFSNKCDEAYRTYISRENLDVIFMQGNILKKSFGFLRILKEQETEIIFSYLYSNNIVASITGFLRNTPHIFCGFRGSMGYTKIRTLLFKILYNYIFTGIITNSYAGRQTLINQGFDKKRLFVIQNGINIEYEQRFHEKEDNDFFRIISIGRFDELKDYETAIKAVGHLVKTNPQIINIKYQIIGYGSDSIKSQLYNSIYEKKLEDVIKIIDNPTKINWYYANANVFLSTSIFEGFSNAIMEAMLFKLPVIATNVGDNKYLVEDRVTGFIMDVKSYMNISDKLLLLFRNKNSGLTMGKNGYKKITNEFGLKAMELKYNRLIKKYFSD